MAAAVKTLLMLLMLDIFMVSYDLCLVGST